MQKPQGFYVSKGNSAVLGFREQALQSQLPTPIYYLYDLSFLISKIRIAIVPVLQACCIP